MLKQRIMTALVLLPLALAALFFLPEAGFELAVGGLLVLAAWEWGTLMGGLRKTLRFIYVAASIAIYGALLALSWSTNHWQLNQLSPEFTYTLWVATAWWSVALVFVALYPKGQQIWRGYSAKALIGWLTLIPWVAAMVALRAIPSAHSFDGVALLLMSLMLVWAADTGGYLFGRMLGRTKLMPRVSPGKTIEGLAGGLLLASLIVYIGFLYFPAASENLTIYLLSCYLSVIAGVLGDLVESMLKRDVGIKDSGSILPGHGGILDRVDSLTAALPIFALGAIYWAV